MLTGVAGGLAERLAVDPVFVRAGFLVLASAGGAGAGLYLLAWSLSTEPAPGEPPARTGAIVGAQEAIAFVLVAFGALLLLREMGLWFGDAITWPIALAVLGSTLIWAQGDEDGRERWSRLASRMPGDPLAALVEGPVSLVRVATGGLLVLLGMGTFLAANRALTFAVVGPVALAVAATSAGLVLIGGPWLWRLARQLRAERRERIRSEERADMAAHLHDSVLQTLALIQRADVSGEVSTLARKQERELRAWLYGEQRDPAMLGAAVEAAAARAEEMHGVPVEVVVVGDATLDPALHALALATGEAMGNAARHSGADLVSVYVEVEPERVSVFVTDQGKGFDVAAVAAGRMGIAESIRGRIQRHGGKVEITSEPGDGTEVGLTMPREAT